MFLAEGPGADLWAHMTNRFGLVWWLALPAMAETPVWRTSPGERKRLQRG
jgi:hypothetical protein